MEIKIIETSDMHGYIVPTNYTERNMDLGFSTAKAATVIRQQKKKADGPDSNRKRGLHSKDTY